MILFKQRFYKYRLILTNVSQTIYQKAFFREKKSPLQQVYSKNYHLKHLRPFISGFHQQLQHI